MSLWKKLFGKKSDKSKNISNQLIGDRYAEAISKMKPFRRTAYFPIVEQVNPEHNSKSKIGGLPYLVSNTDWPICPNCNKHMQLFLQLNMNYIPEKSSKDLIQLFYCVNSNPVCEVDMEAFLPFAKSVMCRKININGESCEQTPIIDELFEEKTIIDWKARDDYPHYEEWAQLGINFEIDNDIYDLMHEKEEGVALGGDKLFGWPSWVQSEEYPNDRKTGKKMEMLFQLNSEDNLAHMFGDLGVGHLTISPDNPNELGFGWAC